MGHIEAYAGNKAMATGVKLSRVNVIAAYPITPQTTVVEYLSEFVNNGELNAEYIESEGEHGMLQETLGAAQAGARTFTSTCAQGFMYAYEGWPTAAHARLPIVCGIVNRSSDFSIYPDHSDSMLARDWGWMQFYVENAQESIDTIIQAYRICEDKRVYLPAFVCQDGFYISYTTEPVNVPDQAEVDAFLPPFKPIYPALTPGKPSFAAGGRQAETPMAMRLAVEEAMKRARLEVIPEINEEFGKKFGRTYGNGLVDEYLMDDAEVAVVTLGSISGSAKTAADEMRKAGKKAGVIRIRAFRPFPIEDIQRLGKKVKVMTVFDRHIVNNGTGGPGPAFLEVKHALWSLEERPNVLNFIVGIAGLEVSTQDFVYAFEKSFKTADTGVVKNEIEWYPNIELHEIQEWKEPTAKDLEKIVWPGTTQCQGCGENLVIKTIAEVLGRDVTFVSQVGCGGYSGTNPGVNPICLGRARSVLPGAPGTASGITRAYKALGKKGLVVLLAGDGSYGDMGFMAASGAAERNEDFLVVCIDNEAYMNTGGQRSGSTSYGARTTTTPVGSVIQGKSTPKKDLPRILAAHHIPYVATATVAYMADFKKKLLKAATIKGHRFIHVSSPCPTGWRINPEDSIKFARLDVQSGKWPIFEIENGNFKFTVKPKERIPVKEGLTQGRFRHMKDAEIDKVQKMVDDDWAVLESYEKVGKIC